MWIVMALLAAGAHARSFIGVTSRPSFRFGNDLGKFEWFADVQWKSEALHGTIMDSSVHSNELDFEPSVGCNVQVYDSLFTAYLGGALGTVLSFFSGEFSDVIHITACLGGGIEWRLMPKLSILGEYMLSMYFIAYPDKPDSWWADVGYGFTNKPSIQLRYYIGPWQ